MLIILEGPDGSGKSTLARQIVEQVDGDVEIFHRGIPTEHPLIEYEDPLLDYRPGCGRNIICDRWHLGEWVYPRVMGRKTVADYPSWYHIEMFLRARGAVVVPLMPSTYTLRKRLAHRGDDYVQDYHLDGLVAGYNHMYTKLLNATADPESPYGIVRTAIAVENTVRFVQHRGSYVGPAFPKFVFVGERREFEDPYPPAFGPFRATSGHYLLDAMYHNFVMATVGFMNAYEEDLAPTWESLSRPRVAALGRRADVELRRADVPHGAAPHPQYVRRFHHKRKIWYAGVLHRAVCGQEDLLKCRP